MRHRAFVEEEFSLVLDHSHTPDCCSLFRRDISNMTNLLLLAFRNNTIGLRLLKDHYPGQGRHIAEPTGPFLPIDIGFMDDGRNRHIKVMIGGLSYLDLDF